MTGKGASTTTLHRPESGNKPEPVTVWGLAKTYTTPYNEVLADLSFTLHERETLAIIGPSGFGKSTLLNIIAGLLPPNEGEVLLRGESVQGPQGRVGYLTQKDTLLPWRTAYANVELPLILRGIPESQRRAAVESALAQVNLSSAAKRYPGQLSGGMRRRVSLARMLVTEPEVLLLDEPFSALDAQLRAKLQQELINLVETMGRPAILVTHDLVEALTVADRVLVLTGKPGRISAEVRVPFPRPRAVADVRSEPGFGQLETQLWNEIGGLANDRRG